MLGFKLERRVSRKELFSGISDFLTPSNEERRSSMRVGGVFREYLFSM